MTPQELNTLSSTIREALEPYITKLVQEEARLIPFKIREAVEGIAGQELRLLIRQEVQKRLTVDIHCSVQ